MSVRGDIVQPQNRAYNSMHKGKPTARWGRKASGLLGLVAFQIAGLPAVTGPSAATTGSSHKPLPGGMELTRSGKLADRTWLMAVFFASTASVLAACSPDEFAGTSPSPAPGSVSNSPPTISGQPSSIVTVGSSFSFQPTAVDQDGDALSFQISGKPAWANFSTSAGLLAGTPTEADVGTYANVIISVTDGEFVRSIGPFTITVRAGDAPSTPSSPAATGTATLQWSPPTSYIDGTPLPIEDLAGYHIYHGTRADSMRQIAEIEGATTTIYIATELPSGTHYFAVSAYTVNGSESAWSPIRTKTIPPL